MDRTANAGTAFKWSVGSNPTLSARTGRWFNHRPVALTQTLGGYPNVAIV